MEKAEGRKPLALLIPGLDGTGRLYSRQIAALSGQYRVRAWEFRPRDRFELSDLADELAAGTADEEPGSLRVVAESFGGMIAMQFALSYPGRIRQMVLINTFAYYRWRTRIRLGCRLAGILDRPLAKRLKDFVVDRTLASEGLLPADRQRYREAIRCVYYPAYGRRLQLVRDMDLRSRLREISVPACLLASGRDKLVPSVAEARYMHAMLPGSTIYEFPKAGHALLLTPGFVLADYVR